MDVFKEYNHIFLTTVLLISNFSTFAVAVCTLPTELHNSVWNYQYTDLSNNAQTTTLTFGRTTLAEPSNIRLNALGTILNAWTCISNLTLSSTVSVAVFKSDASYSDFNANTKWVYICMKLTKVADDLFYFYLLSDEDSSVYPKERVYQSSSIPDNTVPVCSTFCQYTSQPRIRTLKKSGSSTTLPSDVSLCEPCDSSCEGATTETTSLKTTQNTTLPSISSEIDITLNITERETTQKTTTQSNSTEMVTATEMSPLETTQKITDHSVSTEMVTSTEMTPLETTQKTTAQSISTKMVTSTEMTPLETTQRTTAQSTSTEMVTSTEMTPLETTQKTTAQSISTKMVTSTEMTPLETTQKTTAQSTSTEMVTSTEMTPLETTQKTTAQSTSTEMVTSIEMTPLETTQKTTAKSTSTKMVTSTEMTPLETTQRTTAQSTSTETVTSTEMTPLATTQKTTAQSTSTEMDPTAEKKSTQKSTLPTTSTNLVTPIQNTTIHIMFDMTETNININVLTTDAKDKTTMDTQSTGGENWKRNAGSISLAGVMVISSVGSLGVIITFKVHTKRQSKINTRIEDMTPEKEDKADGNTPKICYRIYKGRKLGFQNLAIQHWECP